MSTPFANFPHVLWTTHPSYNFPFEQDPARGRTQLQDEPLSKVLEMPRKIALDPLQREWLVENHGQLLLIEMAAALSVCVDTLKRILVREGLATFDGAKFAPSHQSGVKMWDRPCMCCRTTTPRPKGQYVCDPCTDRQQRGLL